MGIATQFGSVGAKDAGTREEEGAPGRWFPREPFGSKLSNWHCHFTLENLKEAYKGN
ncbi:hypothetical protein [Oryza sativa Japonica Group]|uniref:Uncharacterized protein n=1 Tax=Oryza sativa subsp. japonica TaxID=39947 RepID=Q656H8_ORYSJ|nr:hypothetical protein [Oryza sativa Japonica Group]